MAQADYALQAGNARTATFAEKAQEAQHSKQSDHSIIAKQAARLVLGGDNIMIDSTNHYVFFFNQGEDPSKAIILDIGNHALYNVDQISSSDGTLYAKMTDIPQQGGGLLPFLGSVNPDYKFSSYRPNPTDSKVQALQKRIEQLEAQVSAFTPS